MFKESQTWKLKAEHQGSEDLPKEITIGKIDGETIVITSEQGTVESTAAIIEMFYELKEELSLDTLPKHIVAGIDEVIRLFDAYAVSQDPITGMSVKSKLIALKSVAAKIGGEKPTGLAVLGRKLS